MSALLPLVDDLNSRWMPSPRARNCVGLPSCGVICLFFSSAKLDGLAKGNGTAVIAVALAIASLEGEQRPIKGAVMPHYTFELMNSGSPIADDTGIEAPDRESALAYGKEVARELMRGRELQTRSWRLDIYEERGERVVEMPFAAVDPTLDHLVPSLRSAVERSCDSFRLWQEALSATRATMRESRALLARAQGKPYLAVVNGERTIR